MFDFFGNQSPDVLNESLWSLLICSADSSEHAGIIHAKDESSAAEKIVDKGPKSPVWSYSKDMSGFSPSCVSMMSRSFVVEPLECGGLCEEGVNTLHWKAIVIDLTTHSLRSGMLL